MTAVRTVKQLLSVPNRKWQAAAAAAPEVEIEALENVLGISLPSEGIGTDHRGNCVQAF